MDKQPDITITIEARAGLGKSTFVQMIANMLISEIANEIKVDNLDGDLPFDEEDFNRRIDSLKKRKISVLIRELQLARV